MEHNSELPLIDGKVYDRSETVRMILLNLEYDLLNEINDLDDMDHQSQRGLDITKHLIAARYDVMAILSRAAGMIPISVSEKADTEKRMRALISSIKARRSTGG